MNRSNFGESYNQSDLINKKNLVFLYFLVLLKLLVPYLLQNPMYEPHRDELLYLAEGNHIAWGFMEVPPMLSLFARLTHLFGDGMFWIKLWPSLFGASTFFVMGRLILLLGGKIFALLLLFLSFIFTSYLRVFFLFQPNPPEIFFWTMIVFSMIRFVQTNNNKWLYIFGISAGLGMLSKYSVLFYTISVLGGIAITPYRKVYLNKHFWLACLAGFIIFLPNLLWQYNHHFPVLHHMKELRETQLKYVSHADFLKDQLIMFLPCVFIWISGLIYVFVSESAKRFRFAGWAYIFVILILLAGNGKNYYSLGAYPVLFAFGAYFLEQFTAFKLRGMRYFFIAIIILSGLIFIPVALPVFAPKRLTTFYQKMHIDKSGALKWEDLQNHPLPQDFSDMLGWDEMTAKVAKAYHAFSKEEQNSTLIFCNNYGMAGAINYYGKKYNLPEAYSDNASFLYWLPLNKNIQNLILVTENKNELSQDYIKNFQQAYISDSVTNIYAREYGDLIVVEKSGNDEFRNFFIGKIQKDKKDLIR